MLGGTVYGIHDLCTCACQIMKEVQQRDLAQMLEIAVRGPQLENVQRVQDEKSEVEQMQEVQLPAEKQHVIPKEKVVEPLESSTSLEPPIEAADNTDESLHGRDTTVAILVKKEVSRVCRSIRL